MTDNLMENIAVEEIVSDDKLKIADEVIEIIASIEASKVPCVAAMSGGFTDGLAGILGKKNLGKGVRVETEGNNVRIHISLIVEYGCKIHMVAKEVQNAVRNAIQDMTGMNVIEVNVNIVGINIPKEIRDNKEVKEAKEIKEPKEKEVEEEEA